MVEELSPETVEATLDELQVVDIRSPSEFERGHIPGAINVPLAELPRRVDDHDWEDEIVVVCPIGQSSIQAARLLQSFEGVDDDASVASMTGGYAQWDGDLEPGDEGTEADDQ